MVVIFQTVLMRLALCGLAASLVIIALRSRMVRDVLARMLSVWRSLTALGRVAVCAFLLVGVIYGGGKTNSVNNLPPQMMPVPQLGSGLLLTGLPMNGILTNVMNLVQAQATCAERKSANWNVRGAWKDSFWLPFGDGWVFPWGTNHLSGVEVVSYGQIWPTPFDTNAVVSAGLPFEIVRGLTTFGYEFTPSNSYRFVWTDAAIKRDTNKLVSAALELFRNGDVSVSTNGVAAYLPRELPFQHDGFGQDDEWVTANFTNAMEILAVGYPQWVDAQVGEGLTNGLYKLSVTVADDPPETTLLTVGNLSVAVTNAGEYGFLLEKGPAYDLTVFPPSSNVTISAVDDVPTMRGAPMLRSFGGVDGGQWVPDSGSFWTDYAAGMGYARLWWLPWLCGSPDVSHIDPMAGLVTFHADLFDYRGGAASFLWTGSEALTIASPNSQTTAVAADLADWRLASLSVTATFGADRSLTSYLYVSYGTNDSPQVSCSLSVQGVHFINEGDRPERVYPVSVSLICPVETNAVVDISWEGSDGALFWSDAAATQPLSSLSGISLSSVTEESGGASHTFYMTSPNIGSGSFTATFTLPSGETRGVAKSYRAIEPIRRLVCSEIDPEYSCVFNPSRLVYGHPARLKVGVNGNFSPSDVEWSIVSGTGTVVRCEDDFGSADWTATVTATAESGEVVVEARFNEDAIQPRFVLPIVQQRTLPVEAYVICDSNGVAAATLADIVSKLDFANIVLSQVGIALSFPGAVYELQHPEYFCLKEHDATTNANGVVRLKWAISQDVVRLRELAQTNAAIRTFWVGSITNGTPFAFSVLSERSVFMSRQASGADLAHEMGHVLELEDIYDVLKHYSPGQDMAQVNEEVRKEVFGDRIRDWGSETGRGFYPEDFSIRDVFETLLMYGYEGESSLDIPSGTVHGLFEWSRNVLERKNVKVGAEDIKINMED